ncbi:hypothetical protein I0C86_30740 [Plantactinospora sp. S1510]|uniref:BON domain-containing protein n=1 Tax=Plantactinospora alkalitolerans TaxID=2789879 RepID=A0ABS0H4C3_9ACTN|nr:hypothetical protein [Plantactinospora alkalitolerans]MBF9133309.1 hypothetical protein [Plantactinospora alkalitolerans]
MYAVAFTLRQARDGARAGADAATLTDVFWSLAMACDNLEHVHVSTVAGQIEVTLFVQAGDQMGAEHAALALCRRVVDRTPLLAGWAILRP